MRVSRKKLAKSRNRLCHGNSIEHAVRAETRHASGAATAPRHCAVASARKIRALSCCSPSSRSPVRATSICSSVTTLSLRSMCVSSGMISGLPAGQLRVPTPFRGRLHRNTGHYCGIVLVSLHRVEAGAGASAIGRFSIDPQLMIRMLIVGYCFGIRSERRLCEEVHLNLAYRWFCGLGLNGEVPDHSTFS